MANPDLMQLLATGATASLYFDYSETKAFWINGTVPSIGTPRSGGGFSSGFSGGFSGRGTNVILPAQSGFFMVSAQQADAWIQAGLAKNVYYNPFGTSPPSKWSSVIG